MVVFGIGIGCPSYHFSLCIGFLVLLKPIMAFILVAGIQIFTTGQGTDPFILGSLICLMVPFIGYSAYKRISGHEVQAGKHATRVANGITSLAKMAAAA